MPLSELIVRSLPLAIITVSALYVAVSALRARARVRRLRGLPVPNVYPGSRKEAGDEALGWWRSLSTQEQAAEDEKAIRAGAGCDLAAAEERERAAEAAHARRTAERVAVTRAGEINALYRP